MYTFPHQVSREKRAAPEDAGTQRKSLKATGLQKLNCIRKEKLTTDRKLLPTRHGLGKRLWGEQLGFPLQTPITAQISFLGSDRHKFKFQFTHTAPVSGSVSFGFTSRSPQSAAASHHVPLRQRQSCHCPWMEPGSHQPSSLPASFEATGN